MSCIGFVADILEVHLASLVLPINLLVNPKATFFIFGEQICTDMLSTDVYRIFPVSGTDLDVFFNFEDFFYLYSHSNMLLIIQSIDWIESGGSGEFWLRT